jgi:hypothetical protein
MKRDISLHLSSQSTCFALTANLFQLISVLAFPSAAVLFTHVPIHLGFGLAVSLYSLSAMYNMININLDLSKPDPQLLSMNETLPNSVCKHMHSSLRRDCQPNSMPRHDHLDFCY